jgi:GT2 family glycosyltransferase
VQRNRGIDRLAGTVDAIVFLDDDFWMSRFYLQAVETILESDASIVGMTGHVLADGATTAGISVAEADAMLQEADKAPQPQQRRRDVADTYGCNMAFRASAIGAIRFDERMPLYGWQEDVDFSAQVGRGARTIWTDELRGVHLGTKSGKTSGVRFGFSQAVNPLYVCSKGNMPLHRAGKLIAKNVLANAAKSFAPEPNIDRRGRLRGNLLGFAHLISGKLKPEHVLTL